MKVKKKDKNIIKMHNMYGVAMLIFSVRKTDTPKVKLFIKYSK